VQHTTPHHTTPFHYREVSHGSSLSAISPIPEIMLVYVTRQMEVGLSDMIETSKNDFIIIHKVYDLSAEVYTGSLILLFQFVCSFNFVQMEPQVLMQNLFNGPA
jgi:hypothetical protein